MPAKNEIVEIIFEGIEEINLQNAISIPKEINTKLYGNNSSLDSLGLVNLIVNVEEKINSEYDTSIVIADEKAMSQKNSPFKSVDTLAEYIMILLSEI